MNDKTFKTTDKRGRLKSDPIVLPDRDTQKPIPEPPVYALINAQMCGDRFLFQDFPQAEKVGSLFMPQIGDVGIDKARVVGVGPECKRLKVGDIVYKVAGLGETLVTNLGQFRFLPENGAIAVDSKFDGKATPIMKDNQAGV